MCDVKEKRDETKSHLYQHTIFFFYFALPCNTRKCLHYEIIEMICLIKAAISCKKLFIIHLDLRTLNVNSAGEGNKEEKKKQQKM